MEFSIGNSKLGKDTLIINMTSATDCPSRAAGLCSLGSKCYAMKAERIYPQVLPFRRRQAQQWDQETPEQIAESIMKAVTQSIKSHGPGSKKPDPSKVISYVRVSEAGDFRSQADVEKLTKVAELLYDEVIFYGYTARKDLNYTGIGGSLVLNGTNFMIDNTFVPAPTATVALKMITPGPREFVCQGNCPTCNHCKIAGNKTIYVEYH